MKSLLNAMCKSTLSLQTISRFQQKYVGGMKNSITNILLILNLEIKYKWFSENKRNLPIYKIGYVRESIGKLLIHNYSSVYQ